VYISFKVLNLTLIFLCLLAAFTKSTRVNSQEYELKLVDTAGQDEYSIFPAQYSMDIHGYVLVYSITSSKSFEVVQIIYDKLLDMTGKVQLVGPYLSFLDIIVQLSEQYS
jgi:GTPase SAR1 family protein